MADGHNNLDGSSPPKEMVERIESAAEEGLGLVEETICPKMSRIVSTMNRSTDLLQPQDEDSEWAYIIRCWKTWTFGPLLQMALLSFGSLFFPPLGFFLFMFLWERSVMTEEGREFKSEDNNACNKERWIFVNGMCLDNNLGGTNAIQLAKLFRRQIGFFHNPTQGLLFDLFECMVGRTFSFQTPVSTRLAKCMSRYMLNDQYSRVVVICHSQGGIITSAAIDLLIQENEKWNVVGKSRRSCGVGKSRAAYLLSFSSSALQGFRDLDLIGATFQIPRSGGGRLQCRISRKVTGLNKVEVYTFGNAADTFTQVTDPKTGMRYPFYEHYANEGDYIAKIGTLHFDLPGNVFSINREGHFLGEHYLPDFKRGLYKVYSGPTTAKSRLYLIDPYGNKSVRTEEWS